jgi:signal peptidase II
MPRSKAARFWPVLLAVTALDVLTKAAAVHWLQLPRVPRELLGNAVQLNLVYNPGAAFGLSFGEHSRWIFMTLTGTALIILARLYRSTRDNDLPRTLALALVCGGAVGNLIDRLRSGLGVVDFIDIGLRDARWPTFNVADMAVSVGAVLLAWVLWVEDQQTAPAVATPLSGGQPGEAS